MHIVVHIQNGIDLVDRAEIAVPVLISQPWSGKAPVRGLVFVRVAVVVRLVIRFAVLCSADGDV